jgi:hypothetical protein
MKKFIAEFCDDDKYEFFHNHLKSVIEANTTISAFEKAVVEAKALGEDFFVAQLSTSFTDCELPQPIYDAMNGWLVSPIDVDNYPSWEQTINSSMK